MPILKLKPHLNNLPERLSTFIGREREVAEIKQQFSTHRLLTLTGPGGCGKTRLALQAGGELLSEFDDGVWLTEFAPLADAAFVPQALASVLGVSEQPGRVLIDTLADHFLHLNSLLLFDNCEHLIGACAQLAESLLESCPDLRILATSRETLGISGELVFVVPPLSLPEPQPWRSPASAQHALVAYQQSEAVRLFMERATTVLSSVELNVENGMWVAEICRRLDGMPLAIELAAARVRALSVQQIAERLDDRFHLLTGGSRTASLRQQTLAATIDWSYTLLSKAEQIVLQRLSVFAGGWNLEAAEVVCAGDGVETAEVLNVLSHLIEKSIVQVAEPESSRTRYSLLETIRQYAREKLSLGDDTKTLERHATYFESWVDQMAMELRAGPTQMKRFEQLETEHGNISATLEWSLSSGDSELGLKLIGSIFYFWWRGGHWTEWEHWVARIPKHIERVTEETRALALIAMSGRDLYIKRDLNTTRGHSREALDIFRRLDDRRNIAWAIFWLNTGSLHLMGVTEEYTPAIKSTEEAIKLMKQEGDLAGATQGLTNLGEQHYKHNETARAKAAWYESLQIARNIHDELREHDLCITLADLALREGDYEMAMTLGKQGLLWAKERENIPMILSGLASLTVFWVRQNQLQRAARLIGAENIFSAEWGVRLQPMQQSEYDSYVTKTREKMGQQTFNACWTEGQAMTFEQAIDYALAEPEAEAIEVSTKDKFGGLTAREREVAMLVAQGKSNRQIARVMTVGVRTIETYVTRIMNKLGFESRVQIATWAIENGLTKKEPQ
jgi:predicted ATPase/DNA-binding CsgD family transcriptional regulator